MKNKKVKSKISHYNFFTKNRKGDIPITILVIGIVAVCGLAIFSFYISSDRFKGSFVGVQVIEKTNSFLDEMEFYKNMGKEPRNEMKIFEKDWVMGNAVQQNITFRVREDSIEGTLMDGDKKILFVKYKLAN